MDGDGKPSGPAALSALPVADATGMNAIAMLTRCFPHAMARETTDDPALTELLRQEGLLPRQDALWREQDRQEEEAETREVRPLRANQGWA